MKWRFAGCWMMGAGLLLFGCQAETGHEPPSNPFLGAVASEGKEDTGYLNLLGREVHLTLEADIEAPRRSIFVAPAELAQFAVTYLRIREKVYLEILAEDVDAPDRTEWLVDGKWLTRAQSASVSVAKLNHFRIQNVNAVLLGNRNLDLQPGDVIEAKVPVNPYTLLAEAGNTCANMNGHIELSSDVYWFLWNPSNAGCQARLQSMKLTIDELLPNNPESYPEYDKLLEDQRISAAVLFGKLGSGAVEDDSNWKNLKQFTDWLLEAKFVSDQVTDLGERYKKTVGELTEVVDVYGPDVFESVADAAHIDNWQRIVAEHEIVIYNGHSVLGSGLAFEQVKYPEFYQIFQIGSCLSYEYYVRPILSGKGGFANVDVLSNVEPTFVFENFPMTTATLAWLFSGAEHNGQVSWQFIMNAIGLKLQHPRIGVSGARDNCFTPAGSRCDPAKPLPAPLRHEIGNDFAIPDNDPQGVSVTLDVADHGTIAALRVELDVTHPFPGELDISLTHGETTYPIWPRIKSELGQRSFSILDFNGFEAQGPWTLRLADLAPNRQGTLQSFRLIITRAP